MALLEVDRLTKHFRGVTAVDGLSLRVHRGEMVSLIGPNGAGKSTCFNCLSGLMQPDKGHLSLEQPTDGPTMIKIEFDLPPMK